MNVQHDFAVLSLTIRFFIVNLELLNRNSFSKEAVKHERGLHMKKIHKNHCTDGFPYSYFFACGMWRKR